MSSRSAIRDHLFIFSFEWAVVSYYFVCLVIFCCLKLNIRPNNVAILGIRSPCSPRVCCLTVLGFFPCCRPSLGLNHSLSPLPILRHPMSSILPEMHKNQGPHERRPAATQGSGWPLCAPGPAVATDPGGGGNTAVAVHWPSSLASVCFYPQSTSLQQHRTPFSSPPPP